VAVRLLCTLNLVTHHPNVDRPSNDHASTVTSWGLYPSSCHPCLRIVQPTLRRPYRLPCPSCQPRRRYRFYPSSVRFREDGDHQLLVLVACLRCTPKLCYSLVPASQTDPFFDPLAQGKAAARLCCTSQEMRNAFSRKAGQSFIRTATYGAPIQCTDAIRSLGVRSQSGVIL